MTDIQVAKFNEVLERAMNAVDPLINGKSIVLTKTALDFYELTLHQFIVMLKDQISMDQGPTHPDDQLVEWKVYATLNGDKITARACVSPIQ
jgi:hypothetical protein